MTIVFQRQGCDVKLSGKTELSVGKSGENVIMALQSIIDTGVRWVDGVLWNMGLDIKLNDQEGFCGNQQKELNEVLELCPQVF